MNDIMNLDVIIRLVCQPATSTFQLTLCMSPHRPTNRRRRSLSVTTSPFHDQNAVDSCLLPTKRSLSRKDIPRQWDLDSWRRGKRPRTQQFSVCPIVCDLFQTHRLVHPQASSYDFQ
jgi:hypothetical protein